MTNLKKSLAAIAVLAFAVSYSGIASAGLLDKLKDATNKLNAYNARQQGQSSGQSGSSSQDEDPDHPLHLKGQGHCKGNNTATCMDYMEVVDQCMDPLKGYRMKVTGDLIENKLKTEKFSDQQRKNLQEDLVASREAQKNKTDNLTIAGEQNSQRYLSDIADEDQVFINAEYGKFYKKIYNKCMGADHMGVGHRTEMMTDTETMSGEDAVAQYKKEKAEKDEPFNCLKRAQNLRWSIMADMTEKKMKSMKLSEKERLEWEADVISLRDFAETSQGGVAMPKSNDPSNPYRPMMHLTGPEEQTTLNQEFVKQNQAALDACTAKSSGKVQERKPKSGGLVDHSKSPSNPNAERYVEKAGRGNYKTGELHGGSLSAYLGATKVDAMVEYSQCSKPGVGHLAHITADKLEAKLNQAQGISDQKRKEWEEDIAAWREAAKSGRDTPNPPDPDNPYRWYDYVSNGERAAINKEHADFIRKLMKECADKGKMGSPMGSKIKN